MSEREKREKAGYPAYLAGISKAVEGLVCYINKLNEKRS